MNARSPLVDDAGSTVSPSIRSDRAALAISQAWRRDVASWFDAYREPAVSDYSGTTVSFEMTERISRQIGTPFGLAERTVGISSQSRLRQDDR